MQPYLVYLPPCEKAPSRDQSLVEARFMLEGRSLLALILPLPWLVFQRLWFALGFYGLYAFALYLIGQGGHPQLAGLLSILPGIYLLIEGRSLVLDRMERQGWRFQGVVYGANKKEAEERFFEDGALSDPADTWAEFGRRGPSQDASANTQIAPSLSKAKSARKTPASVAPLGLFPE